MKSKTLTMPGKRTNVNNNITNKFPIQIFTETCGSCELLTFSQITIKTLFVDLLDD